MSDIPPRPEAPGDPMTTRPRVVVAGTLPAVGVGLLEEHLDPSTANDLIHDVLSAAAGQTVLLITHRTEGLELVDRVLTLGPGTGAASVDPSAADVK